LIGPGHRPSCSRKAWPRNLLREALVTQEWNVTAVAQRLDLARSHLYALIRTFGLKRA
jgi:transcriptional regulator of acetoin/glycerol metabolism